MVDLTVRAAIVGAVVKHVLVQRLAIDRQAFGTGLAYRCHAGGGADMHHIERCPRYAFCQPDDTAERQVFRQRVVDLSKIFKTYPALADELAVHMHDDVVVLGLNNTETAMSRK